MTVSVQGRHPGNVSWLGQWITKLLPAGEAALQWPHALDAQFLQLLCHTGTGRLIGSSTVEDNLLVFRQQVSAFGDFIRPDAKRAGHSPGISDHIQRMREI